DQQALVARIGHVYAAVRADGDPTRAIHLRIPTRVFVGAGVREADERAPRRQELAAAVELLDAVVPGVGYVHVAGLVNGYAAWPGVRAGLVDGVELGVSVALRAPLGQVVALAVVFLDAVVGGVHHVHVPVDVA